MKTDRKIRYALMGAGNIAQMAVLPAFKHAKSNSELVAIISSDVEKERQLGEKYDIQLTGSYDKLEEVLEAGAVDAVYIATPNSLHKAHALRVAAAGAHVLCEKPLATSVEDGEAVARACSAAGVKLMVAYRLHFEEATLKALELVRAGKIGDPRIFESVFSHVVRPGDIRDRPETGGGAMLDLGVYCVNAARNLFSDEPVLAFATPRKNATAWTKSLRQFCNFRAAASPISRSAT